MEKPFMSELEGFDDASSELDFQELEMMDAPGWGTAISVAAGVTVVSVIYATVAT